MSNMIKALCTSDTNKINYAEAWFQYSSETKDIFLTFMVRWMAYNYLYSRWYTYNELSPLCGDLRKGHKKHDEDQIVYGFTHSIALSLKELGVKIDISKYPLIAKHPIEDMRYGKVWRERHDVYKELMKGDLPSLLVTIYYIRCNLMHGSKKPGDYRDEGLVVECSEIIYAVLECIIGNRINLYPYVWG